MQGQPHIRLKLSLEKQMVFVNWIQLPLLQWWGFFRLCEYSVLLTVVMSVRTFNCILPSCTVCLDCWSPGTQY